MVFLMHHKNLKNQRNFATRMEGSGAVAESMDLIIQEPEQEEWVMIEDDPKQACMTTSSSPLIGTEHSSKFFQSMPEDLLGRVFSFLPVLNVFRYRIVCRRWHAILTSHQFLRSFEGRERWIAVFDGLGFCDERALLLYDTSFERWRKVSLSFLPPQFDIAVAAAGGLLCVASKAIGRNVMCICNPLTKTYKELPDLQLDLVQPHAIMERKVDGSVKIYVLSSDLLALYDSKDECWLNLNIGEPVRPRSPVICDGAIYGLRDEGSLWWQSWKLVFSKLGTLCVIEDRDNVESRAWAVLNQTEWGEIPTLVRHPRLLGANGCLLLIGGLKKSALSYSCSTFVIFRFNFMTLEWQEIAKMPADLYWGFEDMAVVKIFGSTHDIFFLCKDPQTMVVCSLSSGQGVWRRIVDCPDYKYCAYDLCKGFPFDLKLGAMP